MKNDTHASQESGRNQSITLFLMTEKGYHFLKETTKKYKSLFKLVVVGCNKSIQKDFEDEIIEHCLAEDIPFVRKVDFKEIESQYAISVSWRWLINHPAEKLIVFHDSILPKYRGFLPLVNALINGEREIGVSAIFGATDFDTGDIIVQATSKISYPLKISDAIQINNENYIKCAIAVLEILYKGDTPAATRQDERSATYSCWRDDDDYRINWAESATKIKRQIDATGYPYKGAYTTYGDNTLRLIDAEEVLDVNIENRDCGKVLFVKDGKPIVICGEGMLKITAAAVEKDGETSPFFPLQKFRLRFH